MPLPDNLENPNPNQESNLESGAGPKETYTPLGNEAAAELDNHSPSPLPIINPEQTGSHNPFRAPSLPGIELTGNNAGAQNSARESKPEARAHAHNGSDNGQSNTPNIPDLESNRRIKPESGNSTEQNPSSSINSPEAKPEEKPDGNSPERGTTQPPRQHGSIPEAMPNGNSAPEINPLNRILHSDNKPEAEKPESGSVPNAEDGQPSSQSPVPKHGNNHQTGSSESGDTNPVEEQKSPEVKPQIDNVLGGLAGLVTSPGAKPGESGSPSDTNISSLLSRIGQQLSNSPQPDNSQLPGNGEKSKPGQGGPSPGQEHDVVDGSPANQPGVPGRPSNKPNGPHGNGDFSNTQVTPPPGRGGRHPVESGPTDTEKDRLNNLLQNMVQTGQQVEAAPSPQTQPHGGGSGSDNPPRTTLPDSLVKVLEGQPPPPGQLPQTIRSEPQNLIDNDNKPADIKNLPILPSLLQNIQAIEPKPEQRIDSRETRLDLTRPLETDRPEKPPVSLLTQLQNTLEREARLAPLVVPTLTDKDHDTEEREHETQLRIQFAGPVISPPARPDADQESSPSRVAPFAKLEMQSLADERRPNVITQLLNKVETSIEQKIQSLLTAITDFKPARDAESPRIISTGAQNQIAAKHDLPFLPTLIKMIDISSQELRRNTNIDPGKALVDPNRRISISEPMSLKDLIAANRGELPPGRGLADPILGIRGLDPSGLRAIGPDGKLIGADGKLIGADGRLIGADGRTIGPDGRVIGPDGKVIGPDGKPLDAISIKGAESIDGKTGIKIPLSGDGLLPGDNLDDEDADSKDTIDKVGEGDDDGDLLGLLPCDKVKDKKKDGKDGKKTQKEENKEDETRRKYVVREGDTLESIAEKIIGDSRFSVLLEMINRGYIRYHWEGSLRKPMLRVGQTIWLPTSNEVKVHRTLFFTARKDKMAAAGSNDSEPDLSLTEKTYGTLPVLDVTDDEEPSVQQVVKAIRQNTDKATVDINFAPGAGSSSPVQSSSPVESFLPASDIPANEKSGSDWLQIQEFLNRMRIAAETGRLSKVGLEKEEVDSRDLPLIADDSMDIKQLDDRNRIIVETSVVDEEDVFVARLEKQFAGEWKTVAYYESSSGRAVRYLHKSNGSRRSFHLNLPDFVVREMALKDLSRNWKTYSLEYDKIEKSRVNRSIAAAS